MAKSWTADGTRVTGSVGMGLFIPYSPTGTTLYLILWFFFFLLFISQIIFMCVLILSPFTIIVTLAQNGCSVQPSWCWVDMCSYCTFKAFCEQRTHLLVMRKMIHGRFTAVLQLLFFLFLGEVLCTDGSNAFFFFGGFHTSQGFNSQLRRRCQARTSEGVRHNIPKTVQGTECVLVFNLKKYTVWEAWLLLRPSDRVWNNMNKIRK